MLFTLKPIQYKLVKSFDDHHMSCQSFSERKQLLSNSNKQVFFHRYIGVEGTNEQYIEKIKTLHKGLAIHDTYLYLGKGLPKLTDVKFVQTAKADIDIYLENRSLYTKDIGKLNSSKLGLALDDQSYEWTRKRLLHQLFNQYENQGGQNLKNFAVKILYWLKVHHDVLNRNPVGIIKKVLFIGPIKSHEFYYLILLNRMGCDVLYLNPEMDVTIKGLDLDQFSSVVKYPNVSDDISFDLETPEDIRNAESRRLAIIEQVEVERSQAMEKSQVNTTRAVSRPSLSSRDIIKPAKHNNTSNKELSYEELATFAESVVMIKVYDQNGQVVGGGSGVVINREGLIVTNFHVLANGYRYGVMFENDDDEYLVDQIIKYHTDFDLAIFKVNRITKPIQLSFKPLVRGQKIFSIGSPMGLFNTISEGIVSGFRRFQNVDMIQITAPISPGSSGGALLDMYGNLVGITTAGIEGQNLNLTVKSEYIKMIAGNFL